MVSLMKRRTVIFCFECYTATYLQNVGKKEEVLVIKLQFVVVSVLFQPQLCKVTQRFFPQKSRESKNVIHSNVCVTISNPENYVMVCACHFSHQNLLMEIFFRRKKMPLLKVRLNQKQIGPP